MKIVAGAVVRMSEALKRRFIANGCRAHVDEFGECIGLVEGPVDFDTCQGPEVNVRWRPSGLRYGYHPEDLDVI